MAPLCPSLRLSLLPLFSLRFPSLPLPLASLAQLVSPSVFFAEAHSHHFLEPDQSCVWHASDLALQSPSCTKGVQK